MARRSKKQAGPHRRHESLVRLHLERVSRGLIEEHPDVVRRFIGRNAGIYALYKKRRLYYVGLAKELIWRLKHHLKDHHGHAWDRFSIYLTIKDQHLKEIESLLLQIAKPRGNKIGGKPPGSQNMERWIRGAIREKQATELAEIFGRGQADVSRIPSGELRKLALTRFLPRGAPLSGSLKSKVYRARAKPDGRVRLDGVDYKSLSMAAYAAINRPTNGWWFWKVERSPGQWVRLTAIRKAGTPVYPK